MASAAPPATPRPDAPPAAPRRRGRRGSWRTGLGVGLLVLAALLAARQLGLLFDDRVVWPVVLAAGGVALVWRQSGARAPAPAPAEAPPARADPAAPARARSPDYERQEERAE